MVASMPFITDAYSDFGFTASASEMSFWIAGTAQSSHFADPVGVAGHCNQTRLLGVVRRDLNVISHDRACERHAVIVDDAAARAVQRCSRQTGH